MSAVKLYRTEGPDGRGPFRPGFSHVWRAARGKDFPPPWVEAGLSIAEFQALFSERGYQGGTACKSMKQLRQWFTLTERLRLKRLGFRIVSFEAERILFETPTQVIFERLAA